MELVSDLQPRSQGSLLPALRVGENPGNEVEWPTAFARVTLLAVKPPLGSLSNDDSDGNEDGKKAKDLDSGKTTTLQVHHAFCTFLCRRCTTTM